MVCVNPDEKVERGSRIVYCAGAIARAYEALGGEVSYAGKPFRPIYDLALDSGCKLRGGTVAKERILAIGDGVATDIAGAGDFGIRSVFIASGVYVGDGEVIGNAAARLFAKASSPPTAVMNAFVW
jgi:ribonucleotide monophosphatase NagD (HAD superfamily)